MSTNVNVDDLARRALHTFLQAFIAVLGVTWVASGIDVSQITDEASAKKVAIAAVSAVVAAALSALKTTLVGLFAPASTVGLNGSSGTGPVTDDGPPLPPLVTGSLAPEQAPHPHPRPGRHEA